MDPECGRPLGPSAASPDRNGVLGARPFVFCGVEGADGLRDCDEEEEGREGRAELSRWSVLIGNFVRHVEQTGTGWQKIERQTEQTKPTSTIFL